MQRIFIKAGSFLTAVLLASSCQKKTSTSAVSVAPTEEASDTATTGSNQALPETISFNKHIRPLLSNRCYHCHGPDEADRKGDLRLDTREGALEDRDGIKAIVPGNFKESELLHRIITDDEDEIMPPPDKGDRLTPYEVSLIKKWIAQGAEYDIHWAYKKPTRPTPPQVEALFPIRNPIDSFILQKLKEQELTPSPEAKKSTLARRLSLDLTGLPLSVEELDAYLADEKPDAYERLVDQLLAKQSYGEHWARMWLDQARYADSAGYADDPPRTIWAYRDYVIRSFNDNKPLDQFTIEQIAGDLLENPTEAQLVATAFNRNTMTNNEGGTDDEQFRNAAIVDRVNTTLTTWMGTTISCAQCHTHKYDPITQEEYFQLFDIFNQSEDSDKTDEQPFIQVVGEQMMAKRQQLEKEITSLKKSSTTANEAELKDFHAWCTSQKQPIWKELQASSLTASSGATFTQEPEGIIVSGNTAATDQYTIQATTDLPNITAIKLEVLADPRLGITSGPGRNGNFVLNEFRLEASAANKTPKGRFVRVSIPGTGKLLHFAELQVFQGGHNLALGKQATQSTTGYGGEASRGNDGNTDGNYEQNSVTHTADGNDDPWWELDLGQSEAITQIVFWNRLGQVANRADGAIITILDEQRNPVFTHTLSKAPAISTAIDISPDLSVPIAAAYSTYDQTNFSAAQAIDGNPAADSGWAIGGQAGQAHSITFFLKQPINQNQLRITLIQNYADHSIGKFRILATSDIPLPPRVEKILPIADDKRPESEKNYLFAYYLQTRPRVLAEKAKLAQLEQEIATLKPDTTVPVMRELSKKRESHIQIRGNFLDKGKKVSAGVPEIFGELPPNMPSDRLALAKWLVDENNPLTARVLANRLWEKIFEAGIVLTSEEFGSQGEAPTHPELLDWLAVELRESGWDMKKLLRLLVTSSTYRQQSQVSALHKEKDPANRYLARGPRTRLTAEMVRDQALHVSGLLSSKMFGPPVRPPQPSAGLKAAFGGSTDWETSTGEDRYRRGIYTLWRRSNPYPSMATFDAPNREVCLVRRDRTNTPLQSLVTLNDPTYIEAAQSLARQMDKHPQIADAIHYAYRKALARPPTDEEKDRLTQFFHTTQQRYATDETLAKQMATEPLGAVPGIQDHSRLAALTVTANVILNLDEFLMKP